MNGNPDTADRIGRHTEDPAPVEVTDPADPSYVEPAADVEPVDEQLPLDG